MGEIAELLGPVSYLASPDQDLIKLLEERVYEAINIQESSVNVSFDHLAKKFLEVIDRLK